MEWSRIGWLSLLFLLLLLLVRSCWRRPLALPVKTQALFSTFSAKPAKGSMPLAGLFESHRGDIGPGADLRTQEIGANQDREHEVVHHFLARKDIVMYTVPGARGDLTFQLSERNQDYADTRSRHVTVGDGEYILDIGANVGTFSVLLGTMFPKATILAFEPMPTTFAYLCHNLFINNISNVIPYNLGVGAGIGRRRRHR